MSALDLVEDPAPVLVLAPHPDDESLGCGLLVAERWHRGLPAHVACLTDGGASHPSSSAWPRACLAALRRGELEEAIRRLGGEPARDLTWMGFPDAALHRLRGPGADLAGAVGALADGQGAAVLVAPSPEDAHCDHVAGAEAAVRAAALRPGLRLWHYPVWSRRRAWEAGRDVAGHRVDLRAHRAAKRAARTLRAGAPMSPGPADLAHLLGLYAETDDPWGFRTSCYEAERLAAVVRALPRSRFRSALELGCGNGELAHRIAPRCGR